MLPVQGVAHTPAVYSPATTAVLAAVLTSPACTPPAKHQQASSAASKAFVSIATLPKESSHHASGFIKTVPMQHVQSCYLNTSQSGGQTTANKGIECVPDWSGDSLFAKCKTVESTMPLQPFAQLLRLSSDSSCCSDTG